METVHLFSLWGKARLSKENIRKKSARSIAEVKEPAGTFTFYLASSNIFFCWVFSKAQAGGQQYTWSSLGLVSNGLKFKEAATPAPEEELWEGLET